jgi:hypothetical protein
MPATEISTLKQLVALRAPCARRSACYHSVLVGSARRARQSGRQLPAHRLAGHRGRGSGVRRGALAVPLGRGALAGVDAGGAGGNDRWSSEARLFVQWFPTSAQGGTLGIDRELGRTTKQHWH